MQGANEGGERRIERETKKARRGGAEKVGKIGGR